MTASVNSKKTVAYLIQLPSPLDSQQNKEQLSLLLAPKTDSDHLALCHSFSASKLCDCLFLVSSFGSHYIPISLSLSRIHFVPLYFIVFVLLKRRGVRRRMIISQMASLPLQINDIYYYYVKPYWFVKLTLNEAMLS